jgi:undecaprenyl-diphosphatase
MDIIELLKAVLFGIVEGITEWLPISSTGHIILLEDFMHLNISQVFYDLFEIVIQLGAILAVIVLFFHKLNPFSPKKNAIQKKDTWSLWFKVILAVLPSAVLGLLIDEPLDNFLRNTPVLGTNLNTVVVALALILYGVAFILVEMKNAKDNFRIRDVNAIDYRTALLIGAFQVLSIIPGTSRSGATILGAILLGVGRSAGAEFSFFLAIPTMLGASALKLLKFLLDGASATATELGVLVVGTLISFLVSLLVIKALMEYVRKHNFSSFGVYRIILGIVVLGYFGIRALI